MRPCRCRGCSLYRSPSLYGYNQGRGGNLKSAHGFRAEPRGLRGTILATKTVLVPQGMQTQNYPELDAIRKARVGFTLVEIDVLEAALGLGDTTGRIANVVMMGALSRREPFTCIPEVLWLRALKELTPAPAWPDNYHAFLAGRNLL